MGKLFENKMAHVILIGVLATLVFLVILLQFAFAGSGARRATQATADFSNSGESLFIRSFDGGETWKPIFPPAGEEDFPGGADILGFEFHPARTAEIFVATDRAGLWMSPDLGIHWRRIEGSALLGPESRVYAVRLSKSEPVVLFVSVASPDGNVILQSVDYGKSFREVYSVPLRSGIARAIAIDPKYSDHIFLGMSDGALLESEDGGATWIVRARFDDSPTSILQNPSRPASFLIIMDSGTIQTTNDFGKTWEKVSMGEGDQSPGSFFIPQPDGEPVRPPNFFENPFRSRKDTYDFAEDPADFSEFVAITRRGIIRSSDGGTSWRGVETILDAGDTTKGTVALLPGRPKSILFALGADFYRSDDGGIRWKKSALPEAVSRLVTHPAQSDVIFGILK